MAAKGFRKRYRSGIEKPEKIGKRSPRIADIMEQDCTFQSDGFKIEGLIDNGDENNGIIITHPHPLYGGDMHNGVVSAIRGVFRKKEYTTLRFNFRGVGKSEGRFDNGVGEQNDLLAAIDYLKEMGITEIDLAGYSFGSWVNALAVKDEKTIQKMIMVSPPVGFIDFSSISRIPCLKLVITGSRDEIGPAVLVKDMVPSWNTDAVFKMIDGADHFYGGYIIELKEAIGSVL